MNDFSNPINEEILSAWLRLSMAISNQRLVSDLTYHEAVICNILYQQMVNNPEELLTATILCQKMQMLKSQMNRTLTQMEHKGLIHRERSVQDRRQILIALNLDQVQVYRDQHQKILEIVDRLIEKIGYDQADEVIRLLNFIAETAERVLK